MTMDTSSSKLWERAKILRNRLLLTVSRNIQMLLDVVRTKAIFAHVLLFLSLLWTRVSNKTANRQHFPVWVLVSYRPRQIRESGFQPCEEIIRDLNRADDKVRNRFSSFSSSSFNLCHRQQANGKLRQSNKLTKKASYHILILLWTAQTSLTSQIPPN